jgi:hypothetical protein
MNVQFLHPIARTGSKAEIGRYALCVMQAHRNSDGTFLIAGVRYRMNDRADGEFDVIREQDGAIAGRIRLVSHSGGGGPGAEPVPDADAPEIVRTIAPLLDAPRGALPLQ